MPDHHAVLTNSPGLKIKERVVSHPVMWNDHPWYRWQSHGMCVSLPPLACNTHSLLICIVPKKHNYSANVFHTMVLGTATSINWSWNLFAIPDQAPDRGWLCSWDTGSGPSGRLSCAHTQAVSLPATRIINYQDKGVKPPLSFSGCLWVLT